MKNKIILFLFLYSFSLNAQINFNTLPAISSITASSPFPTVTAGGKWRKATAAQMQAFIMPRPVTRVAPTNRYVLGYISGSDSLQYIPGGIMSQLPLGNVTIAADTSQWTITSLAGINFVNAAAGSGWVNRVQTSRSTTNFLTFKAGKTVTVGTDTTQGAVLRFNTTGIYAKEDSLFITPENLDSISTGEVLTVVGKISNRAYVKFRPGGSGGSSSPTGAAGGDLTGTYPNPTIGNDKVISANVLDGTLVNADLASQTVDSNKIKNGVVTTVKIADDAITSAKVAAQTIDSLDVKNRSITLLKVAPGSATNGQLPTFNSSTNTWSLSAGLKAINGYLEVDENGVAAEAFELRKRDRALNIPVPTLRPKQTNQVIAFDIMPNGTPSSEYFDNGYAWIDVCSADVQNNANAVYTARIGVRPSRVEFGTKKYGGDFKPLVWLFDTTAVHAYYPDGTWYLRPSTIYLQNPGTGTAVQGLGLDSNNKIVTTALGGGSGISALTGDVTASGSGSVTATIANDVVDSTNVTNASLSLNDLAQFGATANQVLTWDNSLSKWRPRTSSSITGTNNQTLRINSSGVPEASSVLTNDGTNLVTTGRLTATGLSAINNASGATNGLVVRNQSVSGYSNVEFRDNSDNFVGYWGYGNASITPTLLQGRMYIGGINKAFVVTTDANTTASIFTSTSSLTGFGHSSPTARVHAAASTTSAASYRVPSGTAPTSPNEGDIWHTSNDLHFYTNSTDAILARVLKGSATLDFGSTAANSETDLTITVTGAADGDVVSLGVPNASATTGTFFAWVSATNTVTVRFHNGSGGSVDPASGTFKVTVTK